MIDSPRLLADLRKLLARLEDDLRIRSEEDAATGEYLKTLGVQRAALMSFPGNP